LFLSYRTINNVESHIKNALLQELLLQDSAFKNIKIDPETVEIKRLLDHEVLRTATFVREQVHYFLLFL